MAHEKIAKGKLKQSPHNHKQFHGTKEEKRMRNQ